MLEIRNCGSLIKYTHRRLFQSRFNSFQERKDWFLYLKSVAVSENRVVCLKIINFIRSIQIYSKWNLTRIYNSVYLLITTISIHQTNKQWIPWHTWSYHFSTSLSCPSPPSFSSLTPLLLLSVCALFLLDSMQEKNAIVFFVILIYFVYYNYILSLPFFL